MLNFYKRIPESVECYRKNNVNANLVAEEIDCCFTHLINKLNKLEYEDFDSIEILNALLTGSFHSWLISYTLCSAGFGETAYSELRRSIEYLCYSSKLINNKKRMKAWVNQQKDQDARKLFTRECSIPMAYTKEKYRFLWPLMMAYEHTCYYGSHGNLESLSRKKCEKANGKILLGMESDNKFIETPTLFIIQSGYKILEAYSKIIENDLRNDIEGLSEKIISINEKLKNAKMVLAYKHFGDKIPQNVIDSIENNHEDEEQCNLFKKMIQGRKNQTNQ